MKWFCFFILSVSLCCLVINTTQAQTNDPELSTARAKRVLGHV